MKIKRSEYIFSIGFSAETAIVDGNAMRRYGRLSTEELISEGLYKAAFASALYGGDQSELDMVLKAYNQTAGTQFESADRLKRVLGLDLLDDTITKVRILK